MSGALDYSQYRIDDIVERIEKEIEQATCERPPLVTEQGVCVKRKVAEGRFDYPSWLNGFRTFESAEKYFKECGYKEVERLEEYGERILVMYDPALDETYRITTYTRKHYPTDEDGNEPFYPDYTEETLQEFRRGIAAIKRANAYLRCIDELIDYNWSEDAFHRRLKEELDKLDKEEENGN